MRNTTFLAVALSCSALTAQAYTETFSYPDGPVPPLWTQQSFTFAIQNQRLIPTGGRSFHYMTSSLFQNVKDCALDIDVYYPPTVSLHYGGVCARHPGGPGENGLVMLKLQDNSSGGTYNSSWLYERPGTAQAISPLTATIAARVRMIVKGNLAWQLIDTDMDGIFDVTAVPKSLVAATTLPQGLIGICGYNGAEMDNYKFFDGVLIQDQAGGPPAIGTNYRMTFTAPLVNNVATPWRWAMSFGKTGIPLGDGRSVPLSLDPLFSVTLSIGFGGLLDATNPDGTITLPIPNDPSLIGATIFTSAFTIDPSKTFAIGAIANDHMFRIQ